MENIVYPRAVNKTKQNHRLSQKMKTVFKKES